MTTFNDALHPRASDGTFTEKERSAPEARLDDFEGEPVPVGDPLHTRFVVTTAHGEEVDAYDPVFSVRTTPEAWFIEGASHTYEVPRHPDHVGHLVAIRDDEEDVET